MSSSSSSTWSPPLKRFRQELFSDDDLEALDFDYEDNQQIRTVLIVCDNFIELCFHKIDITRTGIVQGSLYDDLPLVDEKILAINETKVYRSDGREDFVNSIACTNLGSNELVLIGDRPFTRTQEFIKLDVKSWSYDHVALKNNFPTGFLVGACGDIYALSFCSIKRFDYVQNSWEPLDTTPFSSFTNVSLWGYVVIEQYDLIVACVRHFRNRNYVCEFYSFNVRTMKWNQMNVEGESNSIDQGQSSKQHDLFSPYKNAFEDNISPFQGKAEFVDGVIYGCFLCTVVIYHLSVKEDNRFSLKPPILKGYGDALTFQYAPLGLPRQCSSCISHLGDNLFCVVQTATEIEDPVNFQPVYINTFLPKGNSIRFVDSTVRFVAVNCSPDARILHCFTPSSWPEEQNRQHANNICPNFEEYIHELIPRFCICFLQSPHKLLDHARMLFANWRSKLECSTDCRVVAFLSYMICRYEHGPEPDPFLLIDKNLDKGLLKMEKVHDSDKSNKSIFMVATSYREVRTVYRWDILRDGVISNGLILPLTEVAENEDALFRAARLGNDVYVYPADPLRGFSRTTHYSFINSKDNVCLHRSSEIVVPNRMFAILGNGLKVYALSNPSRKPNSIPKPAFQCLDPFSGSWEALDDAPFHSVEMDDVWISGYAIVDEYILVSLDNVQLDFYAYNMSRKYWRHVDKVENTANRYYPFEGKAEYVDGKIYLYRYKKVFKFALDKLEDNLRLHPSIELHGLDMVSPPLRWGDSESMSRCLTHLGGNMFFVLETGSGCYSADHQYACFATFAINESGDIQTLHSSVRVLYTKGLGLAHISCCFSQRGVLPGIDIRH